MPAPGWQAPGWAAQVPPSARRVTPQQFQRESNLALVMQELLRKAQSRSELARRIGIDRSTMTSLAADLLEAGLVNEQQHAESGSRGGRKARLLSLAPARVVSCGISVSDEFARWTVTSLPGEPLTRGRVSRMGERDSERWLALALHEANEAIREWLLSQESNPVVAGVGVALPGVVRVEDGMLVESVMLELTDVDVAALWRSVPHAVAHEVSVDNDANCGAWNLTYRPDFDGALLFAQIRVHESTHGLRDSIAGVGLSLIINGRMAYGSSGAAGELCGYRWRPGLANQLGVKAEASRSETISSLATEVLANLGVIASVLDPDRVVVAADDERVRAALENRMAGAEGPERLLRARGIVRLVATGDYPDELGAARMVLNRLFLIPTIQDDPQDRISWRSILDRVASSGRAYSGLAR